MEVFSQLSFWPKAHSYKERMAWTSCKSNKVARHKNKLSSAKKRCEIFRPFLNKEDLLFGHYGLPFEASYLILPSIAKKDRGTKGRLV